MKIVVLQRGWVVVGNFSRVGEMCTLTDAAVIRAWGTTEGLGELASKGPLPRTRLDPCPDLQFHILTTIMIMDVTAEKWS